MAFEFSDTTHTWCPRCAGNIRSEATWCRYCVKNISSRFSSGRVAEPQYVIGEMMIWLPGYDELTMKITEPLKRRFQVSHDAAVEKFMRDNPEWAEQRKEKRKGFVCSEFPPEKVIDGLLQDVLLSMQEAGADMQSVCNEPRMMLLEITPQVIASEAERRRQEEDGGHKCPFCQEYVFTNEVCRFCTSNLIEPPEPKDPLSRVIRPLDTDFLNRVILWEAARQQSSNEKLVEPEILEKYGITPEMISAEVERQSVDSSDIPISRWRRRMRDLNIESLYPFAESHINDILSLGSTCDWERSLEPIIVFKHGLSIVGNQQPMIMCKQRLYDALANYYVLNKDKANYNKYKKMANDIIDSLLPEPRRKIYTESQEESESFLTGFSQRSQLDPKQRLEEAEKSMKKAMDRHAQMAEHTESPELLQIMQASKERLQKLVGGKLEVSKMRIAAHEAVTAGELPKAKQLLEEALCKVGDGVEDVLTRSSILSAIAKVHHLEGNTKTAEVTFRRAIELGEEVSELNEGKEFFPLMLAHHAYGKFLSEVNRYEEAEKHLYQSIEMNRRFYEKFDRDFRRSEPTVSEFEAKIKQEIAQIMRSTGRLSEAEKLEADAACMLVRAAEQERIRQEKRSKNA